MASDHQALLQIRLLEKLSRSMDQLGQRLERFGGGGTPGSRGAPAGPRSVGDQPRDAAGRFVGAGGGGGVGSLLGMAGGGGGALGLLGRLGGPAGLALTAVGGIAASAAGGGLIAQQRGGSFANGAVDSLNRMAAAVPVLGELSGAAPIKRISDGALADMNDTTNEIARFGGVNAVGSKVRNWLADMQIEQNRNVEADRQANQVAIQNRLARAGQGQGVAGDLIGALLGHASTINHAAAAAGHRQHQ